MQGREGATCRKERGNMQEGKEQRGEQSKEGERGQEGGGKVKEGVGLCDN